MVEKYSRLKNATAAIIRRREEIDEHYQRATRELAQTEAELGVAMDTNQDDVAVLLLQKKNQLAADIAEMQADLQTAQKDADSAKSSLITVQSEIKKLKAERESMLAKMQSAQARIKIQEQLDGLSVDAEVKALDNVRQHIRTTIAEANLGRELSESSLDARLAGDQGPGRRGAGAPAAGRAEGEARGAAGGAGAEDDVGARVGQGTGSGQGAEGAMKLTPFAKTLHHGRRARRHRLRVLVLPGRHGPEVGRRRQGGSDGGRGGPGDVGRLRRAEGRAGRPARGTGSTGVTPVALSTGAKLSRPLVVAINTWAGHAPGIVFNGGLDAEPGFGLHAASSACR